MFLSFTRKRKKQLLDKGLYASKKIVHKAGEYLGNKIADAILLNTLGMQTKANDDNIEKQKPVEEITIPPEKEKKQTN